MVAQRKSLPQAVPNSICVSYRLVDSPPKSGKTSSQGQPSEYIRGISSLGHENGSSRKTYIVSREMMHRGLRKHSIIPN